MLQSVLSEALKMSKSTGMNNFQEFTHAKEYL